MKSLVFYLGIALLFTHELDAMPNHEWRMLPLLNSLRDSTGRMIFLIGHVPIFAVVVAFIASMNLRTRTISRNIVCGFLIAHAVLHFMFSGHAAYEFSTLTSSALIYGAALSGVIYFLAIGLQRRNGSRHL